MNKFNIAQAKRQTGLSYIGGVSLSSKMEKSEKYNELTYVIYLAPAKLSGYNVCPQASSHCIAACLHESGQNRMDIHENRINKARIKKTKLFYEDRELFVRWTVEEIRKAKAKADKEGKAFSVRLNGTSDLSPELFKLDGKNILEIFPDIQFYDYTKVAKRLALVNKYPNYDLTYSFSGDNWEQCEQALGEGFRISVVFDKLPQQHLGYKVVDGDIYDMRYKDPSNCIVGLKFKKVRTKIDFSSTPFVIQTNCG